MRIVFLNQYALPAGSAGITRHADIGAELVRRGHDVTIIASTYDYLRRRGSRRAQGVEIGPDGVQFVWLDTGAYAGNDRGRTVSMVRYGQAAARATIRLDPCPDVIVGSSAHLLAGLAALVAARRLRVPWVLEVRDFWPSALVDLGAIKRGGMTHRALLRLERYLYERAARIVSVPPNGTLRLRELGLRTGTLVHVPNFSAAPASTDDASPTATAMPPTLDAAFGAFAGRFILVYAGSLGQAQGWQSALEALAELGHTDARRAAAIGLILIGDGVQRAALERSITELGLDNVLIHGPIDKAAVPAALARADAGVLQLGDAGFLKYGLSPNKLFDYFAAGKPVLIASAHPTIVDEAGAGLRYEPGDPGAFTEAVTRLMELPADERRRMGERGRELVRTRYSIGAVTDTYEALLREVIAERRR